jgi:hypothetical protein
MVRTAADDLGAVRVGALDDFQGDRRDGLDTGLGTTPRRCGNAQAAHAGAELA